MNNRQDLTGKKYGMLTVVKYDHHHNGKIFWLCQCNCGKTKTIQSGNLKAGKSNSCGCQKGPKKHGLSAHPLYKIWNAIKTRCLNSKTIGWQNYGGRGITVCDEWINDPMAFIKWGIKNGWKDGLDIDRINNNADYSPANCRFVTRSKNCLNKRNNRLITYDGQTKTLTEWAGLIGKTRDTIQMRLKRGWAIERAFNESIHINKIAI